MSFKIYKHHGTETILNPEKIILIVDDPENKDEIIIHFEGNINLHADKKDLPEIKKLCGLVRSGGINKLN